ncbi:MAG: VWA domain-containing protein [Lewinellaceae bacterium]|nr:VWA domain-containing protein [Lewinellaceae bacterium]
MSDQIQKWRLILGQEADPGETVTLEGDTAQMDNALEGLYQSDREGGLGDSSPKLHRWLGDIRKYFPAPVVQILQRDAWERLGIDRMLLEPELLESLEPDISLVGTLLTLKGAIPAKTRETARLVVQKLVHQLEELLRLPLEQSVRGAMTRSIRTRRPKGKEIDWHQTIRANLKHYQPDKKGMVLETLIGQGRRSRSLKELILLVDQSASMTASIIYAGILGSILASLRSLKTSFIVFDTQVADLSGLLDDPVELLFSTQMGGGTDIQKALAYAEKLVDRPRDTTLVVISDLYEGANVQDTLRKYHQLLQAGVQIINILALDDEGAPDYDKKLAQLLSNMGIPSFACSPEQFPRLMGALLSGTEIQAWMQAEGVIAKG